MASDFINHADCNVASIKTLIKRVQKASGLVNMGRCWEGGCNQGGHGSSMPLVPRPCPAHLFHAADPELYPVTIN